MSASLPPRPSSLQNRTAPEQHSASSQPQHNSSPVRARSEDSQTLFLNSSDDTSQQQDNSEKTTGVAADGGGGNDDDEDVKKCWICFSDSTEDTPQSSPWRDPCPCALVAHEECLLDWIADVENPNKNNSRSIGAPKIECPQCKAEIHLARPKSYVVDAVRGMERLGSQLVTPGALTVLFGTVYNSSLAWGIHTIYALFGAEDGFRILEPMILNRVRPPIDFNATAREVGDRVLGSVLDHLVHWRLYVGLPLITPILILSRTKIADSVLPMLPIVFFATQTHSPEDPIEFGQWPPSASLAFAILPYVRTAYTLYYQKVWGVREKQWLKEIQPRATQGQGEDAVENVNENDAIQQGDDENVFEIRVDGGIWEEWEDEENMPNPERLNQEDHPRPEGQDQAVNQAAPPPDILDNRPLLPAAPEIPEPQQAPVDANNVAGAPAGGRGGERRLSFSPTAIAETVLGALVFPSIASVSGELLKLVLPRSWTTSPLAMGSGATRLAVRTPAKGLLQEKWGRSLVGGCLFVVLKDAVMLYVRWKMAQMHRRRTVLDYERPRKAKGRA